MQISVAGFAAHRKRRRKARGRRRAAPAVTIGNPTVGVFSMFGCGGFSVTVPPNSFEENATAGWRVEITPLKVVNHAVTFRLRWVRALDTGQRIDSAQARTSS